GQLSDREVEAKNWLSKFGAAVSDFFIYRGFGLAAYILAGLITTSGIYLFFNLKYSKLFSFWFWGILMMLWLAIFFGFFTGTYTILGGRVGFEINDYLQDYIGFTGTILLLAFLFIAYLVIRLKITPEMIGGYLRSGQKNINEDFERKEPIAKVTTEEKEWVEKAVIIDKSTPASQNTPTREIPKPPIKPPVTIVPDADEVQMEIKTAEEEEVEDTLSQKLVKDFGEFDPTLELKNYKWPTLELLKDYNVNGGGITV